MEIILLNKHQYDSVCVCQLEINGYYVCAELDTEIESPTQKDFVRLENSFIKTICAFFNKQEMLLKKIVREVVNAAYEQSSYKPQPTDYKKLADELRLHHLYGFEGGAVLTFYAPTQFPDYEINIQITKRAAIDDIALNEKAARHACP